MKVTSCEEKMLGKKLFTTETTSSTECDESKSTAGDIIESDIVISGSTYMATSQEADSMAAATTAKANIHFTCSGDETDSFSASTSVSRSVTPPNESSSGYNSTSKCTCMSRSSPSSELENFSSSFKKFTYENNLGLDGLDPLKLTSIRSTADIFGRTFAPG